MVVTCAPITTHRDKYKAAANAQAEPVATAKAAILLLAIARLQRLRPAGIIVKWVVPIALASCRAHRRMLAGIRSVSG